MKQIDQSVLVAEKKNLVRWYQKNKREFPWRKQKKNPYSIWISEVMLQQTQAQTVIPYYNKFLSRFPNITTLAKAKPTTVVAYWSGLGYYQRAYNLHKAAKIIHQNKYFPQSYHELLKLPGFGPYTARAVSSIAFEQETGVLDANVIRVLSRYLGWKHPWWKAKYKNQLQKVADDWVINQWKHNIYPSPNKKLYTPSTMNQALMELGALICTTPAQPLCQKCPIHRSCVAFNTHQTQQIPLKKPKKNQEIWLWKVKILNKKNQVALISNHQLPFLKKYLVFPGNITKQSTIPKNYHLIHFITHHTIYVQIQTNQTANQLKKTKMGDLIWFNIKNILKPQTVTNQLSSKRHLTPSQLGNMPSSLIQKILRCFITHKKINMLI